MKRLIFFLFAPLFLCAAPLRLSVPAEGALLMNAENGRILYAKKPHASFYPSSTTKIGTALYAAYKLQGNFDDVVTAAPESLHMLAQEVKSARGYPRELAHLLQADGTTFYILPGEQFAMRSLLEGMLVCSGNDAANVIAYDLCGDVPLFTQEMNAYLQEIGCTGTHFLNPHGLHHPEHVTTPYDLACMARESLKHPVLIKTMNLSECHRPKTNKQKTRVRRQSNQLLRIGNKHYYPHAFGFKTGTTSDAGYNLVAGADDGTRTLIAVVLNGESSQARYKAVRALFDLAFAEEKEERLLYKGQEQVFTTALKGAKNELFAELAEDVVVTYYPSEEPEVITQIVWDEAISLPIQKGTSVGVLQVDDELGNRLLEHAIVARYDVEPTWPWRIKQVFQNKTLSVILKTGMIVCLFGLIILLLKAHLKKR